jgi:hypothetical protein
MTAKLCLACLRTHPLDAFPPLAGALDGRRSMCLTCLGPSGEMVVGARTLSATSPAYGAPANRPGAYSARNTRHSA